MEEGLNAGWLDQKHPNYKRWQRGRDLRYKRAAVVKEIISSEVLCENLDILDLGSGEGGTSSLFAEKNRVISFDLSLLRLTRQKDSSIRYSLINGRAESLPFRNSSFDMVILQDVVEHIEKPGMFIRELSRILRTNGSVYLSTPNRNSIFNLASDPHWGIPLLALFKRPSIKKYFLSYFRKSEMGRNDLAELFSLNELKCLFNEYTLYLKTAETVSILGQDPEGVMWSSFHLGLFKLLQKSGSFLVLRKLATNEEGFINNYFTPTLYAVLKKDTG